MRIIAILLFVFTVSVVVAQPKPFVLGVTEELYSNELKETRTLNIYLPQGYSKDDTVKYPVIYLLDGGADEDFIHVAGLVQFCNFEWVHRVPRSIVVGIANTNRERDMSFPSTTAEGKEILKTSGGSAAFISFIEKELQPYIRQHYGVNDTNTLIGESLGGLLATEILLKHPQLFSKYIITSPSIWWDNGSILNVQPAYAVKGGQMPDVYISVGKEGKTPGAHPRIMEDDAKALYEKLKKTAKPGAKLYFNYMPDENHATIGHIALYHAFRKLYN